MDIYQHMDAPRMFASAFVYNEKIFLVGGFGMDGVTGQNAIQCYDPTTRAWSVYQYMDILRVGTTVCAL